ncbi:MAG TPA: hypothetical protein VGC35_05050 [Allosphingosinicella sp.]|jgi:hypothetical protein
MNFFQPVGRLNPTRDRWTKDSRIWIPELGEEHRIRIERVKDELRVEETARNDAHKLQPETADAVLNEAQLDICNRVFAGILLLNQFLAEQLGQALDAARRAIPAVLDQDDLTRKIEIEADDVFSDYRGDLRQLRHTQIARGLDLRFFKNENRLRRGADYRESALLIIGIVLAMLVVESAANGMLFRDVVRGGWLGGVFLATIISVINVGLGIFAGLVGWSNVGHVRVSKRVLGWAVTLVLHVAAIAWNLCVAHFREAAEAASASPTYDFNPLALAEQMQQRIAAEGLFGVHSLFALALLAVGLAIHFLAAREGWDDMGDRYPDYMKVDRKAKDSERVFDKALVHMRAEARAAAESVVRDAEAQAQNAARALTMISDLENLAAQRVQEVRDSEDQWVSGGTQLLRNYRDINIEVRGDNPPPAYFRNFPTPDEYRRGDFGAGLMRENKLDAHMAGAQSAREELSLLRTECERVSDANAGIVTDLRSEVNRVLSDLTKRIDDAEHKADRAAREQIDGLEQA